MNGISMTMSKSCCPMYSFGTGSEKRFKVTFGTSNKMDLSPCRSSNLHHLRFSPLVASKPILKHRVYSSNKDETGWVSKVPGAVVPCGLLGIFSLALLEAWKVVAQSSFSGGWIQRVMIPNAGYCLFLGVAAASAARGFIWNIKTGLSVLGKKPFSPGDIIEVGDLKGQVIEMGLMTTSVIKEDRSVDVPTPWLNEQDFVKETRKPWRSWNTAIYAGIEEIEKIPEITKEIRNLMRSQPLIYLEEGPPYCYLSAVDPICLELSLGCNLKLVSGPGEEFMAQVVIRNKSIDIVRQHGVQVIPIMGSLCMCGYSTNTFK